MAWRCNGYGIGIAIGSCQFDLCCSSLTVRQVLHIQVHLFTKQYKLVWLFNLFYTV